MPLLLRTWLHRWVPHQPQPPGSRAGNWVNQQLSVSEQESVGTSLSVRLISFVRVVITPNDSGPGWDASPTRLVTHPDRGLNRFERKLASALSMRVSTGPWSALARLRGANSREDVAKLLGCLRSRSSPRLDCNCARKSVSLAAIQTDMLATPQARDEIGGQSTLGPASADSWMSAANRASPSSKPCSSNCNLD